MNITRSMYNNNTFVNSLKDSHGDIYFITIMYLCALCYITLNASMSECVCVCECVCESVCEYVCVCV
jgi:hypothetical protein